MAASVLGVLLALLAVSTAWPEDYGLIILDSGPRFQYMSSPQGLEVVDLAWRPSDLLNKILFNPETDVNMHLYTRKNPKVPQLLVLGANNMLASSNYNPAKKTVVIAHGWKNTPDDDFNVLLVAAYLQAEDINMISVDWSTGARASYDIAIFNNIRTGKYVAKFITWLNSVTGSSLDNYHLIGHSLGGQQVGIIGRYLGGEVAYITALDPAMPGWTLNPFGFKSTDGKYTEVIHTNAGLSGRASALGDVDFYPNQGFNMPGCSLNPSCNHHRCIFYMAESLVNGGFTGHRCDSMFKLIKKDCDESDTLPMGGPTAKPGATGIYYLKTNDESPYSQG